MRAYIYQFVIIWIVTLETILIETATIHRERRKKRGILSRTGICPSPSNNFNVKDNRLNFYGFSILLPGDESVTCTTNECAFDDECNGDRKCCNNHCGAFVCTEAMREPHPCWLFDCPATKICKIQRVRCIDPYCPDMYAVSRPVCVSGGPIFEIGKRSRIPRPNLMAYDSKKKPQDVKEVVFSPQKPFDRNSFVGV